MKIERRFVAEVPLETAWSLLVDGFYDVADWATGIDDSYALDTIGPAGLRDRELVTPRFGTVAEHLATLDEHHRTLTYVVTEGAPSFAPHMSNTWWLEPAGPEQTTLSFELRIELRPLAAVLLGWLMKWQLSRACDQICADFRSYVETGLPSPVKHRAIEAHARRARAAS